MRRRSQASRNQRSRPHPEPRQKRLSFARPGDPGGSEWQLRPQTLAAAGQSVLCRLGSSTRKWPCVEYTGELTPRDGAVAGPNACLRAAHAAPPQRGLRGPLVSGQGPWPAREAFLLRGHSAPGRAQEDFLREPLAFASSRDAFPIGRAEHRRPLRLARSAAQSTWARVGVAMVSLSG